MVASKAGARIDLFVVADAVLISLACVLIFFAYSEISGAPNRQARLMAEFALATSENFNPDSPESGGKLPAARPAGSFRAEIAADIDTAKSQIEGALNGATLRFYSEHSDFLNISESKDDFLVKSLQELQAGNDAGLGMFTPINGKYFYRAAAPVRAAADCADCKARGVQDYRRGDIIGLREAVVPVGDQFVRIIRQLLYATAVLAAALMCVLGVIFPMITRNRKDRAQMKNLTVSLEREVLTDALTGLANRRYFENALDTYLREFAGIKSPLSLLLFDIDHFKSVNDTHGHDAGDIVLKEVASRLKSNAREYDVVARIGGDEFAILTPYVDQKHLIGLAERYRHSVGAIKIPGRKSPLMTTISIGVATSNGIETDKTALFKSADEKLYAAKRAGRNRFAA